MTMGASGVMALLMVDLDLQPYVNERTFRANSMLDRR